MRLIGVGLLAFVLIGVIAVLGRGGAFASGIDRISGDSDQQFSDYERATKDSFDVAGTDVFTTGQYTGSPLILSGLPSYSGQRFKLPLDSRPVSGRYQLAFSSRVSEGVEGALRVAINGVKRADILLNQKTGRQTVEVELTASELASGVLDVGLSLQGRGAIAECRPEDSIAAVVEIKPESGLRLKLDKTVETTRDKIALWGGRVPVQWNEETGVAGNLLPLVNSARMVQKGYYLNFASDGLDSNALGKLVHEAKPFSQLRAPAAYPVPLTAKSANRGVRKFDRQTSWRYNYSAGELPGGILPSALDMRMAIGPTGSGGRYDVTVMLNDHMLFARRLALQTDRLNQSIALPAELHQAANKLEISLAVADVDDFRCGSINQSYAELLPESVLRGDGGAASDGLSVLREELRNAGRVSLTGEAHTAVDGQTVAQLLAQLNPEGLSFVKSDPAAHIKVLTGDVEAAARKASKGKNDWLVYPAADRNAGTVARRVNDLDRQSIPAVALLVSIPGQKLSGDMP